MLVTGGAGGIGQCVARRYAEEGARVVVNDLGCGLEGGEGDELVAEHVADELQAAGGKAVASAHDVATADGARAAVQTAVDAYGGLDVLVCCAGIARDRTLLKMEEATWDSVVTTMLKGTFLTIQAAARQMVAQGRGGRIVAMTGLPGYLGGFAQANLAAACGGVHGLVRTAAIELQKHRITVNAIAPLAKTRMTESLATLEGVQNVTPEYVAPVALFLGSDLCGDRTGVTLAVAGPRVHSFRFSDSAGKFKDDGAGVLTPEEILEHWATIMKG